MITTVYTFAYQYNLRHIKYYPFQMLYAFSCVFHISVMTHPEWYISMYTYICFAFI